MMTHRPDCRNASLGATPDGTGLRRVTDVAAAGGSAVHPTFTSDGSRIVSKLTDPSLGVTDVMASVAIDGTDPRSAAGDASLFGWHPRPRPTPGP